MRSKYILLSLCTVLPLSAQDWEVGLFAGRQQYHPFVEIDDNSATFPWSAADKTVLGVRLGYSFWDLGPARMQATLGYQPSTSTSLNLSSNNSLGGSFAGSMGSYKESHTSAGLMCNFKSRVSAGVGLELRFEQLDVQFDQGHGNGGSYATKYVRPWLRADASMDIPTRMAKAKPFIGLEADYALVSMGTDQYRVSNTNGTKALAPKSQIGVDVGIRF